MIIYKKDGIGMKMEYQGYNQKLNKLYFNPYSHTLSNNGRISSQQQLSSSVQQYGLDYNGKNQPTLKSMQQLQLKPARQKRPQRLSASQIFTSISKQQPYQHIQQKPTINYFVTQFQRLQKQNRQLSKQLQVYSTNSMKKTNTFSTQQPTFQQKIQIIADNKELRQQLENQQKINIEKNQQIQKLVNRICQVEEEVQKVLRAADKDRQKARDREREIQRERSRILEKEKQLQMDKDRIESMSRKKQDQQKLQIEKQRQQFQRKQQQLDQNFNQRIQIETQKMHEHYQNERRSFLANLQQTQRQNIRIQTQQIKRSHQEELQKYRQKEKQYMKTIQTLLNEKQDRSKEYNEKIEGVKLYYNDIISSKFSTLIERIGELQLQIQAFKGQYENLEKEVQGIRYVPNFK